MNEFIDSRWTDLVRVAKKISPSGHRELMSSLADELYSINTRGIRDMFSFSCSRMRWINDHSQQYGKRKTIIIGGVTHPVISNIDIDNVKEPATEDMSEEMTPEVAELVYEGMTVERAEQYLKIKGRSDALPLPERLLFERYWVLGMTGAQIARETGEPMDAIYKLIREIRTKITGDDKVVAKKNNRSK